MAGVAVGEVLAAHPAPTQGGALLEGYRRTAKQLEAALEVETDTKAVTQISTALNRTYWHIGQLTGEAQITEAKIVRSDAWKNVLTRIEQALIPFPDAASALAKLFESLASV